MEKFARLTIFAALFLPVTCGCASSYYWIDAGFTGGEQRVPEVYEGVRIRTGEILDVFKQDDDNEWDVRNFDVSYVVPFGLGMGFLVGDLVLCSIYDTIMLPTTVPHALKGRAELKEQSTAASPLTLKESSVPVSR